MLKIEVTDEVRRIAGRGDRKGFEIQVCYVTLPSERYPVRTKVYVPDSGPYQPGDYTLAADSFYIGQYDALMVSPRLVPVKPESVRKAS